MAYNIELADELRELLAHEAEYITEKKMFGGYTFLYKGKMTVGIIGENLAVRVVSELMEATLQIENVEELAFTSDKPMKEFVQVFPAAYQTAEEKIQWIEMGLNHAKSKLKES